MLCFVSWHSCTVAQIPRSSRNHMPVLRREHVPFLVCFAHTSSTLLCLCSRSRLLLPLPCHLSSSTPFPPCRRLVLCLAATSRTPLCSECTWSDVAFSLAPPFLPGIIRLNTVAVTAAVMTAASATLGLPAVERAATAEAATAATTAQAATPATVLQAPVHHALAATAATTALAALEQALARVQHAPTTAVVVDTGPAAQGLAPAPV